MRKAVKDQRSALESWTYIARSDLAPDRIAIYLPILLSSIGAVGIAPFAVIRFLNGQYIVAILDSVLVVGLLGLGIMVTGRKRFASRAC